MSSNEVSSLEQFLDMIGGPDEYKGAVFVAALLRTFKKSITYYNMTKWYDTFEVQIEIGNNFSLDTTFRNTYLYLFEEEDNRWT